MSGEQGVLFEMAPARADLINEYNRLNEQHWNLLDEMEANKLGRTALILAIRETDQ